MHTPGHLTPLDFITNGIDLLCTKIEKNTIKIAKLLDPKKCYTVCGEKAGTTTT